MDEHIISDVWTLFKEYLDKKQIDIVAEKYVDLLADYGVSDSVLKDCMGTESNLDSAIQYYLELDEADDEEDWDE
jgi:hypothetical protein